MDTNNRDSPGPNEEDAKDFNLGPNENDEVSVDNDDEAEEIKTMDTNNRN